MLKTKIHTILFINLGDIFPPARKIGNCIPVDFLYFSEKSINYEEDPLLIEPKRLEEKTINMRE